MIRESDLIETGPGIFYTSAPLVAVDGRITAFLREAARRSPTKRARLCAHPSPDAAQQDMVIVSLRETYVAPHRHAHKSETMLILDGLAQAVVFDDGGAIADVLPMGPSGSGRLFFYRMPPGQFHGLLIESDALTFVESTLGPFSPNSSEFAPWAPKPGEEAEEHRYAARLRGEVVRWTEEQHRAQGR